jgi:hypothetical protein
MPSDQQVAKRAVIYARTSADSENEGLKLSIEEQLDACKNLAQSHGYNIIGEYFDRNRSGRTYPKSLAISKLWLEYCRPPLPLYNTGINVDLGFSFQDSILPGTLDPCMEYHRT